MNYRDFPHRRYNPLTGEWVKVSPHRTKRPWNGQTEESGKELLPEYEKSCYLCPGNERAGGSRNPDYRGVYVFNNDYAALLPETEFMEETVNDFIKGKTEKGLCRVICYSDKHNITMARMSLKEIENIINIWKKEYTELSEHEFINHVQIFENKGAVMGCSNPHPHGQIWAEEFLPNIPHSEIYHQKKYSDKNKSCLLCDYIKYEIEKNERVIYRNSSFAALVPYWAVWPFETMILPLRHITSIIQMTENETADFADIFKKVTVKYDNLFKTSFPYSMGIHQSPTDGKDYSYTHMHVHFAPPLLRSATVKKFMVGYELMAMSQRDITPEKSAEVLKELSDVHYREKD